MDAASRTGRWVFVLVLGFLVVCFGLIYLFAKTEQRRVNEYNALIAEAESSVQTGNMTYQTRLFVNTLVDAPPYVLETSTSEQEVYLLRYCFNVRSHSTNNMLMIDFGMTPERLKGLVPPTYSNGVPRTGTHVGFHRYTVPANEVAYRERLYNWSFMKVKSTSATQQYLLVSHFHPTICIDRNFPSTVTADPFLTDRSQVTTPNGLDLVFVATNMYLLRRPGTREFLSEVDSPASWRWNSIQFATTFVIVAPSVNCNEPNNFFPKLVMDRSTQLYGSSVVAGANTDTFSRNLKPISYEPLTPAQQALIKGQPTWSFSEQSSVHVSIRADAFKREDIVTSGGELLVKDGWFFQNYRVTQSIEGYATGMVVGATAGLYGADADWVQSMMSNVTPASPEMYKEPQLDKNASQYELIIDRAFVAAPNPRHTAQDNLNVYAVRRSPDPYNNPSNVASSETSFDGTTSLQGKTLMHPYTAALKTMQFRIVPWGYNAPLFTYGTGSGPGDSSKFYYSLGFPFAFENQLYWCYHNIDRQKLNTRTNYGWQTNEYFLFVQS